MIRSFVASYLKSLLVFLVLGLCLIPILALAQGATPESPTVDELLKQALSALSTWRSAGWIAGMLAVVNLAVNLTKFPFVDKWLSDWATRHFWLRPAIAVVFGLLSGFLGSLVTNTAWPQAIIAGLLAGLGAIGGHEVWTTFNARVRVERAAGAKLVETLQIADKPVVDRVATLKEDLDKIAALTTEEVRLKALSDWANAH
jgi:hypothetical protein